MTVFGIYQGESTIIHKVFDVSVLGCLCWKWKPYPRVVFQVQIGLSIVLYIRSLFLMESCDLCPSSQYIFVRMIPSCFHFAKMCLCQVSLPSRCSLRFLTFSSCTLFIWTGWGAHFSSCGECDVDRFGPVSFYSQFFKPVLDCRLWRNGWNSDRVGKVGRSAVYSRYINGPKALPWCVPALTGESSAYSVSTFTRECLLCK
jgi:hypothetical protein